jgi:hypothetical protein
MLIKLIILLAGIVIAGLCAVFICYPGQGCFFKFCKRGRQLYKPTALNKTLIGS